LTILAIPGVFILLRISQELPVYPMFIIIFLLLWTGFTEDIPLWQAPKALYTQQQVPLLLIGKFD
jgi:hypothetical protein